MSIDQDSFRSRIIATPRSGGTDDPRKRTFEEREGGPPLQNQPTPAGAASPSGRLFVSATERPKRGNPTQIGRFTVLRPIGQGGMGVVYACYDEQLDRKVAVKVLHVEVLRDLAMARARLLREAQTMARLSHANIVTVYEVGQDDDLVHIAMEFVRGVGLDVWTNPERPWQQLLATFVQAGRGLEAAHRAGIIHRDFKPQNVIVGEDGVVKVLDFGLARAADGNLREEWLTTQPEQEESFNSHLLRPLTRTGLLLGTPAYMSPEQHCGEVATAASDQFSFCVSLYQCLYGVLPFSTTSLAALRHDVMKGHVAPAPLRSPVPLRIFRALRRGMMTNPEARFSSMTELLTTLERDPGVRYRRLAGLTATAALTGALGFTLASGGEPAVETCPDARPELVEIWSDERAAEIRQSISTLHGERGMKLLSLVEPQVERYAQGWVQLRNEACRAHAEGRQSDQLFDLRTACLEQRRASLDALTNTLAELDASSLANIAQATASLPPLETCADAQALTTEVPLPDDAKMRVRVQGHRETLARVQVFEDIGQYRAGLQLAESVLADDLACKYEPLLAEALLHKGSLQMESGDSTEAEKTLSQALWAAFGSAHERVAAQASSKRIFLRAVFLTQWSQAQEEIPEVRALNKRVQRDVELYAEFLNNIAAVASMAGKWAQARQWYEESLALRKKHGHTHTTKGLFTQANLGELASIEKRYQDAVAINREVIAISEEILGPEHPRHLIYKQQLGENLARMGRLREALTEMREIERLAAASDDKELRGSLIAALGWVEIRAGEIRRAKEHFQRALQLFPEVSNRYDIALWGLMQIAAAENDQPGVQRYHDRALARLRRPLDPNDFAFQELLISHGRALATLGHLNEAVEPLARVRSMLAGSDLTFNRIQTAIAAYELGKVRLALGELDEAQEALDSALTNFQGRVPDTSLEIADVMLGLGELALQRQRLDDAVRWLAQAEAIYLELAEPDYPALARTRFIQARALTGSSPQAPPDARTQAELALQAFRAWSRDDEAHAVETWLHDHQSP